MKAILIVSAIALYSALSAMNGSAQIASIAESALHTVGVGVESGAPRQNYITAAVTTGSIRKTITATGAVTARESVDVGSQLSGQIAELKADFNQPVKKDQVLAVLDDSAFKQNVLEARAALAQAQANLAMAQQGVARARIAYAQAKLEEPVLEAKVDQARAQLRALVSDAARQTILARRGVTAAKVAADAVSKRDAAAAALREAKAVLAVQGDVAAAAQIDVARAQSGLKEAKATVDRATAALRLADINLERTRIRAPINGVIVGRSVDKGQTLATALEAHTLFTIAGNLKKIEIYARVDESDIGRIKVGQKATFTVDAFPSDVFHAAVKQIRMAPQIQQNVVTYTVVLRASNPDVKLLPGMTALVAITVSHTPSAMEVPLAALRFSPVPAQGRAEAQLAAAGEGALWVANADGRPRRTIVKLGDDDGRRIAVTGGGLAPGAKVILGVRDRPSAGAFSSGS